MLLLKRRFFAPANNNIALVPLAFKIQHHLAAMRFG